MQIFTNPKGIFETLLALGPDYIVTANPRDAELTSAAGALQRDAANLPKGAKVIPFGTIKRIQYNEKKPDELDISYKVGKESKSASFSFVSDDELVAVYSQLKQNLSGFTEKRQELNAVTAAIKPLIFTVFFAAVTYGFFRGAQDLASGADADTSGRRGLIKKVFVWLLEVLGPIGVLIVGGIIVALCIVSLVKRVGNPPVFVSLIRQ
ncbi:hypothetical protein [Cerasicoccus fimbriatus]|uniref:hypothetical protein n=1 Tax=Cerasicoccus fimbriatus TaxID=3014554 RepID=UPI0022B59418|nr:hypothetical protein [Cerasicoccus sp. TK19100]